MTKHTQPQQKFRLPEDGDTQLPMQKIAPQTQPGDAFHEDPVKREWNDIGTVPRDTRVLRLTPDGETSFKARWKKSREFDRVAFRWELTGYWVDWLTSRKIEFEPLGWADL